MFLRIDKLQIELPAPTKAGHNAAAAVQELLGGRVVPGHPEGGDPLPGTHNAAGYAPEHDPAEIYDIAKSLMKRM